MLAAAPLIEFEALLVADGVGAALRWLNRRTPHRFTAVYRFDPPMLRNLHLVDSFSDEVRHGDDAPLHETYCSIVRETGAPFSTDDTRADARLEHHPARENVISYFGVPLRDRQGEPVGALCHFDMKRCEAPSHDEGLLLAAADLVSRALAL